MMVSAFFLPPRKMTLRWRLLEPPAVHSKLPSQAAALPVIVDTDLGNDDIFAIAYIARHPGVELLAVTVSGAAVMTPVAGLLT